MSQPQTTLLTRRRWDRIFGLATIAGALIAGICSYFTGQVHYWSAVFAIIGMWAYIRRATPASGERVRTIAGDPGTIRFLLWQAFLLVGTLCFIAFDTFVLKQTFNSPLKWYHWLFFSVMFILMVTGCDLIDRARARSRAHQDSGEQDAGGQQPTRTESK